MKKILLHIAIIVCLLSSCSDADNLYSSISAHFTVDNVISVPVLNRACTGTGTFCTVTYPTGVIKVKNYTETNDITVTDVMKRTNGGILLGLGGLIIGMPSTPEMLQDESHVVCFDLCCPNCYIESNNAISKLMTLGKNNDDVTCSRCQRTYDLNNSGIVSKGDAGRALFRYYVSFSNPYLRVNNR